MTRKYYLKLINCLISVSKMKFNVSLNFTYQISSYWEVFDFASKFAISKTNFIIKTKKYKY